ncbi:hypothetical protein SEA_MELBA_34 [Gordonia phage Melba]|nr:hypothetical protein SEA_MELBA_34 [Gordonia phage Melba]WPH57911.1 hypothetical protein SEA_RAYTHEFIREFLY_34 [Gordonia phage RayTheFireFly]
MADTRTDQHLADQLRTDRDDEQNTARAATDEEFLEAYSRAKTRWSGLLDRLK